MTRQAPAGPCEEKIMTRPLAVGRGAILTSHDLFFAKNYDVIVFRERPGALMGSAPGRQRDSVPFSQVSMLPCKNQE